jgi:hypothetical protein
MNSARDSQLTISPVVGAQQVACLQASLALARVVVSCLCGTPLAEQ